MNKNKRKNEAYPIEGSNFIMYNTPPTGAYEQEFTSEESLTFENKEEQLKDEFSKHDHSIHGYDF